MADLSDCSIEVIKVMSKNTKREKGVKNTKGDNQHYRNGPKPPDTSRMTEAKAEEAMNNFQRERKKWTDAQRKKRIKGGMITGDITFTGDNSSTLRTMEEVRKSPLRSGDTFQTKDILLMRIAEEANLRIRSIMTDRSDDTRLVVLGHGFKVV